MFVTHYCSYMLHTYKYIYSFDSSTMQGNKESLLMGPPGRLLDWQALGLWLDGHGRTRGVWDPTADFSGNLERIQVPSNGARDGSPMPEWVEGLRREEGRVYMALDLVRNCEVINPNGSSSRNKACTDIANVKPAWLTRKDSPSRRNKANTSRHQ